MDRLRNFRGFCTLSERELFTVISQGQMRKVRKDRALYYQSDPSTIVYFILTGEVKKIKFRSDESSFLLPRAKTGEWLAVAEVILDSPYLHDAVTATPCELLSFSKGSFRMLMKIESLKSFFLKEIAHKYYLLHGRLAASLPTDRLISYIISHAAPNPRDAKGYAVYGTQEELAEAVGVTRETVNKYLRQMQDRGLISIERGKISVPDVDILKEESI